MIKLVLDTMKRQPVSTQEKFLDYLKRAGYNNDQLAKVRTELGI